MTNEEMSLEALKLCKKTRIFIPANEYLDTAIESLEENTKLKAEIEGYKLFLATWNNANNELLKYNQELKDANAKLCEEIAELKKDLEYSVQLPCKIGDNLYRPIPRLYRDISKMKVLKIELDESGCTFTTSKGTKWSCSLIGKSIFKSKEDAEKLSHGKGEQSK